MGLVATSISGSGTSVSVTGSLLTSGYVSAMAFGNSTSISAAATIPENFNFVLYGPITINNGVSFIIPSGSAVVIKDIANV